MRGFICGESFEHGSIGFFDTFGDSAVDSVAVNFLLLHLL